MFHKVSLSILLYESCLSGCTAVFFLVSSHYKQATYMQENQNGLRRRMPLVPQHTAYPCSLVMIDIYILNTTTDAILLCHSSISSEYLLSVYRMTDYGERTCRTSSVPSRSTRTKDVQDRSQYMLSQSSMCPTKHEPPVVSGTTGLDSRQRTQHSFLLPIRWSK